MDGDVIARWVTPSETCVADGRRRAETRLGELGLEGEQQETAVLLVSELLTNAVRHGVAPVALLVWRCDLRCAVVEVHDVGGRSPEMPSPNALGRLDPFAVSGRGLAMVAAYTRGRCGATRLYATGGKSVWFSLPTGAFWPAAVSVASLVASRICGREVMAACDRVFGRPVEARPAV